MRARSISPRWATPDTSAARLDCGAVIHNVYVPAGGDIPDREENEKFGQKLDFLAHLRDHFRADRPSRAILVGDLNVAPHEDDVWSHKQMLKVVSHTPIEVEQFEEAREEGRLGRRDPRRPAHRQALLLVVLPLPDWHTADKGRRLDHVWASKDIVGATHGSRILRDARAWDGPSDHVPGLRHLRL
jgi:exodeoxyribonuclease-3